MSDQGSETMRSALDIGQIDDAFNWTNCMMMPKEVENLVLDAIADRWSRTNLHGVNLRKCLVRPERIVALDTGEDEMIIWLELLEDPETRLGYGVGYHEETGKFGLIEFTKDYEPQVFGLYDRFFEALDAM